MERDWNPEKTPWDGQTRVGGFADEEREWIKTHPVIQEASGAVLLRFANDEQLMELVAQLNRIRGGQIQALAVLQQPKGTSTPISATQGSSTHFYEGRVLVVRAPSTEGHLPNEPKLPDEELARIGAEIEKQNEWLLEHGYAVRCPNCGDVVAEGKKCRCGRTTGPMFIDEADLRRYGLA